VGLDGSGQGRGGSELGGAKTLRWREGWGWCGLIMIALSYLVIHMPCVTSCPARCVERLSYQFYSTEVQ